MLCTQVYFARGCHSTRPSGLASRPAIIAALLTNMSAHNLIRYLFVCLYVSQTLDQTVMVGPTTYERMNTNERIGELQTHETALNMTAKTVSGPFHKVNFSTHD